MIPIPCNWYVLQVYDYYRSGAESESTIRFNREAFSRLRLLPRMLVNVQNIDISTQLLGKDINTTLQIGITHFGHLSPYVQLPLGIAGVASKGLHKLFDVSLQLSCTTQPCFGVKTVCQTI